MENAKDPKTGKEYTQKQLLNILANGLSHVYSRQDLLIKILKQIQCDVKTDPKDEKSATKDAKEAKNVSQKSMSLEAVLDSKSDKKYDLEKRS